MAGSARPAPELKLAEGFPLRFLPGKGFLPLFGSGTGSLEVRVLHGGVRHQCREPWDRSQGPNCLRQLS